MVDLRNVRIKFSPLVNLNSCYAVAGQIGQMGHYMGHYMVPSMRSYYLQVTVFSEMLSTFADSNLILHW